MRKGRSTLRKVATRTQHAGQGRSACNADAARWARSQRVQRGRSTLGKVATRATRTRKGRSTLREVATRTPPVQCGRSALRPYVRLLSLLHDRGDRARPGRSALREVATRTRKGRSTLGKVAARATRTQHAASVRAVAVAAPRSWRSRSPGLLTRPMSAGRRCAASCVNVVCRASLARKRSKQPGRRWMPCMRT